MVDILVFFIGASLLLYVLLGGSDYGAGILELLPAGERRDRQKHVINDAMGPVWEANHIWLILVVVILFMGFPTVFTTLMIALHVPMLALLVGIVVRGTAFTFRHYDAHQEPVSQRVYTILFGVSSLWSALWLGVIVASLGRAKIDRHATDVWSAYFAPWWGLYPLAVGVFVVCIFVFLASVYLIGETEEADLRRRFTRFGIAANAAVVLSGGLVFLAALGEHDPLHRQFLRKPETLGVVGLATLMCVALWTSVRRRSPLATRVVAGAQVTLILLGWWLLYAPDVLITTDGAMTFYATAAPPATQRQLVLALVVGSAFIFPSLFFLLRVFKSRRGREGAE
jgi:cytochrome d ubiquinol oxidase subunit II